MKKLVVLFPGIGYHCDKPLLYYGLKLAKECGYEECLQVNYTFTGDNIKGNQKKLKEAFYVLYQQAQRQLDQIDLQQYNDIIFLSKSIGTIIASAYAHDRKISCKHVLYTPLTHNFLFRPENGISFLGTKDSWSNVEEVIDASDKAGLKINLIENANHSLETEDTLQNIEILRDVMKKTKAFLRCQ